MSRNLADLKKECEAHGLQVQQTGKREAKADYELALRTFYWERDNLGQEMPEQIQPMLARNSKDLAQEELDILWKDDNNWVAQEKINGCRAIIRLRNPKAGRPNHVTSRRLSDETYRLNELHDVVPHYRDLYLGDEWEDTVVDGELLMPNPVVDTRIVDGKGVVTADILQATAAVMNCAASKSVAIQSQYGKLVLHAFDLIRYKGKDLRKVPYTERYKLLEEVVARVNAVMGDIPCQHCEGVRRVEQPKPAKPEPTVTQDDFFDLLDS